MKRGLVLAIVLLLGFGTAAQAGPILGQVDYTGTFRIPTTSFNTSTYFNVLTASVDIATLDFGALMSVGDPLTHATPIGYAPPAFPVNPLWTHVASGLYFNLADYSTVFQNSTVLALAGTGTFFGPGFDPTPGEWTMTLNRTSGSVRGSFSASQEGLAVPDPGSTLLLLGLGLTGLVAARRRWR